MHPNPLGGMFPDELLYNFRAVRRVDPFVLGFIPGSGQFNLGPHDEMVRIVLLPMDGDRDDGRSELHG